MKAKYWIFCIVLLMFSGCASLQQEPKKVVFFPVSELLRFEKIEPELYEKEGLKLRIYQQNKVLKYNDRLQIFTQITGQKGTELNLNNTRKVIFAPGTENDNFYMSTETDSKDLSEKSNEKLLMNNRGEIVEFVRGELLSRKGHIKILSWSRTPIFPEKAVNVGDSWTYDETIQIKLESFWITRKVEGPDKITVKCKLTGFAEIRGHRCAVIETRIVNSKNETYTALFKTMTLNIKTHISEQIFFDYKRGLELGRISKTDSFTTSEDMQFSDVTKSQSVSILEER